jgi:hypothetical protein
VTPGWLVLGRGYERLIDIDIDLGFVIAQRGKEMINSCAKYGVAPTAVTSVVLCSLRLTGYRKLFWSRPEAA